MAKAKDRGRIEFSRVWRMCKMDGGLLKSEMPSGRQRGYLDVEWSAPTTATDYSVTGERNGQDEMTDCDITWKAKTSQRGCQGFGPGSNSIPDRKRGTKERGDVWEDAVMRFLLCLLTWQWLWVSQKVGRDCGSQEAPDQGPVEVLAQGNYHLLNIYYVYIVHG